MGNRSCRHQYFCIAVRRTKRYFLTLVPVSLPCPHFCSWRFRVLQANTIDTAGVMRRVLRLFRGYNKLTLTFNTFLPEGYNIELCDIKVIRAENAQVFRPVFVFVCACLVCGVSFASAVRFAWTCFVGSVYGTWD